jgi:hypothetical protein
VTNKVEISVKLDSARPVERAQRLDGRLQIHVIVCDRENAAADFAFLFAAGE